MWFPSQKAYLYTSNKPKQYLNLPFRGKAMKKIFVHKDKERDKGKTLTANRQRSL
jgi:hypothetical protein